MHANVWGKEHDNVSSLHYCVPIKLFVLDISVRETISSCVTPQYFCTNKRKLLHYRNCRANQSELRVGLAHQPRQQQRRGLFNRDYRMMDSGKLSDSSRKQKS